MKTDGRNEREALFFKGSPAAKPNKGLELTAVSVRSCVAPAARRAALL
jgi:hypothetical protein